MWSDAKCISLELRNFLCRNESHSRNNLKHAKQNSNYNFRIPVFVFNNNRARDQQHFSFIDDPWGNIFTQKAKHLINFYPRLLVVSWKGSNSEFVESV